jgi:hypothetical protein
VGKWFDDTIVASNRLPLFCVFVGMLVGFLFIRFSVRMIRAQVKWWPGNVATGGMHVHHVVFGVVFMMIAGVGGFALPDRALVGLCITGSLFGIGAALVLDEFALILHLKDVYWAEEGRTSVDAIFVAIAATGLLLVGVSPLSLASGDFANVPSIIATSVVILLYVGLIAITLLKGKVWTGLLGILIPLLLFVGAIRVGRPHSPWARWRYREGKRRGVPKMNRAIRREHRYRDPMIRAKDWVQDMVSGKPNQPELPDAPTPEAASVTDHVDDGDQVEAASRPVSGSPARRSGGPGAR